MNEKIGIVVADDSAEARKNIQRILEFDPELEVIGEAKNGLEAVSLVEKLEPDCILMDINMPEMDGIRATERIAAEYPGTNIVMMSVQGEQEYLRQAMLAGAREYLTKPFSADELISALKRVHATAVKQQRVRSRVLAPETARVVTIFSAKGGVGKTTIASNLAVAMAAEWKKDVILVDLDLQFGDVGVTLDLDPHRTIADLTQKGEFSRAVIEEYLIQHSSGVRVLSAPLRPEEAELVSPQQVDAIISVLQEMAEYVIIDTAQAFQDTVLTALDRSDQVLLISTLDIPTIKNIKLCMDVMRSLNYSRDKISLVINRASEELGVNAAFLQDKLKFPVTAHIPSDGRLVVTSVNQGIPFFLMNPQAKISEGIRTLAEGVTGEERRREEHKRGILLRLFG